MPQVFLNMKKKFIIVYIFWLFVLDSSCGPRPTDESLTMGNQGGFKPRVCNGLAQLCDRPISQVAFAGTHNSFAVQGRFGYGFYNQSLSIKAQLMRGVRALMLDTYWYKPWWRRQGGSFLCHTSCFWGGSQNLHEVLKDIAQFFKEHPHEVILLIIEPHSLSAEDFAQAITGADLLSLVYAHPGVHRPWPTLGELIETQKRLVVFYENDGRPPVQGIGFYHPMWDYFWDTPYQFKNINEFTCESFRGQEGAPFYLVNHFISAPLPSKIAASRANSMAVLGGRIEACSRRQLPNVIAVDFVEQGGTFEEDVVPTLVRLVTQLNSAPP